MTLEGKFIQKQGVRKVTVGIILFLMEFSCQCNNPKLIWKYGCSKDIKNEWMDKWMDGWMNKRSNFSFCWYITRYNNFVFFWLKVVNFLWIFFLTSKCKCILHTILKFGLWFYCIYLSQYLMHIPCKLQGWVVEDRKIVIIWMTFLTLDFGCTLPPMIHPIIVGVSGWTKYFQPTMW